MIFQRLFNFKKPPAPKCAALQVGARAVPLLIVHHPRARRYLLRLRPDGTVRVTIPRRGTIAAAREFAQRNVGWLEQQLAKLATRPKAPTTWNVGAEIYFRGERVRIEAAGGGAVTVANERVRVTEAQADVRPAIEQHLRQLASRELPPQVQELAARHGIAVNRIAVRNQRSRWGSCSRRGTISLNWRLIQMPDRVRDYIIRHELAHCRQMNHSAKFWQEVARLCPEYQQAERWLKEQGKLLR